MVDAQTGHAPGVGQTAAQGRPDQQRTDQTGTGRVGDASDLADRGVRLGHDLPDQRHQLAHVVTGRQFRHDPAKFGM